MSLIYLVNKTNIEGCIELIPSIFNDERGMSIKPFHKETFEKIGIHCKFNEDFMVTSHKGVLRGLHFQNPPYAQAKLIYCVKGSIFDVAVDIRYNSATFGQFICFHIDTLKHNMVYIPEGFAHGYQVLENDTTVIYKMSSGYSPNYEGGIRWNSVNIPWPLEEPILSQKDKNLITFEDLISAF